MSPRPKYTPALAAAVRPIMKLLVAVETFIGSRMNVSIASTLKAPLPMPSRPESTAAPQEVAMTDTMLAPIAYGRLTPKKSVSTGTSRMPPPRPRMAPSTPAAAAVPSIIDRNAMSFTSRSRSDQLVHEQRHHQHDQYAERHRGPL